MLVPAISMDEGMKFSIRASSVKPTFAFGTAAENPFKRSRGTLFVGDVSSPYRHRYKDENDDGEQCTIHILRLFGEVGRGWWAHDTLWGGGYGWVVRGAHLLCWYPL